MAFSFQDIKDARTKSGGGNIQRTNFSDAGIKSRSVDFFISKYDDSKVIEALAQRKSHPGHSAFMKFSDKVKADFADKEEFFSTSVRIYCSKKLVVKLKKLLPTAEEIKGTELLAIPCDQDMLDTLILYKCTPGEQSFFIVGTEADDSTLAVRDFINVT